MDALVQAVLGAPTRDIAAAIPVLDDRRNLENRLGNVRFLKARALADPGDVQRLVEVVRPHHHLALLQPVWAAACALAESMGLPVAPGAGQCDV